MQDLTGKDVSALRNQNAEAVAARGIVDHAHFAGDDKQYAGNVFQVIQTDCRLHSDAGDAAGRSIRARAWALLQVRIQVQIRWRSPCAGASVGRRHWRTRRR